MAFDLAFLKDGRIALQGQTDALLEGARRIVAPPQVVQGRLPGELRRTREGALTSVIVQTEGDELAQLSATPGVRIEALSLEDLFIEMTREGY